MTQMTWTPEDFRREGHRLIDTLADYLAKRRDTPVWQAVAPATRRRLHESALPDTGRPPGTLVDWVAEEILPYPMGNDHPRFFAFVNSPPHPAGALGALVAAATGSSIAGGDQAGVHLERGVIRWLAELVGYPLGGGILTSGGSMATYTALAAARHAAARAGGWDDRRDGMAGHRLVLYLSAEGHSCLRKAGELIGLGTANMRTIPVDDAGRMDMTAFRQAISEDKAAGAQPYAVAANVGTVNTGAIDPLAELADVCAAEGMWLHLDGAYGAFGRLDESIADAYAGLERADSLALDPHKWPGVPADCGALLVKDHENLRDTFSLVPAYLRMDSDAGFLRGDAWMSEFTPEQTRPFRAVKVWATLSALGREGMADLVRKHRGLARELADRVQSATDLELMNEPELSTVCFRVNPPGMDADAADSLNRRLATTVQEDGTVFLTSTEIAGRPALRVCILHPDTESHDLDAVLEAVRAAVRAS